MGLYNDQIVPRLIDLACGSGDVGKWRTRCLDGLSGVVVEPGFGSGLNLSHYPQPPDGVTHVYAVDPSLTGRKIAAERVAASPIEVEFIGLDGQAIPLDDNTCDGAALTFTLCTIPEPGRALTELRRVLKPGGQLHFVEHGQAADPGIATWQKRIDPVQKRLFDGCHVSRDHESLIRDAGFEITEIEQRFAKGPKPWSWFYLGRAISP